MAADAGTAEIAYRGHDGSLAVAEISGLVHWWRVLHNTAEMASPAGFEPTAPGLGILCSILLSYGDV